jgi:hypothetical protein
VVIGVMPAALLDPRKRALQAQARAGGDSLRSYTGAVRID